MADGKYPFLEYIEEPDKEKKYKKASDCGWYDPHNNFLIGDSGGFLLNIRPGKFVNTELFNEAARTYQATGRYTQFKVDSIHHDLFLQVQYQYNYTIYINDKTFHQLLLIFQYVHNMQHIV
jgi:hypothetical protein